MKEPLNETHGYAIWGLLSLTERAIHKARGRELMKYDISVEQSAILAIINSIDYAPTSNELSRYLIRERHSVFQTVNKMVEIGLVKRTRDKKQKNAFRLSLTDKGLKTAMQASKRESTNWIMSTLSEEEGQQLESYLNMLLERALFMLGITNRLPLPIQW